MSTSEIDAESLGKLLWPGIQKSIESSFKAVLDTRLQEIRQEALAIVMKNVQTQLDSFRSTETDKIILQLKVQFQDDNS